jgi:hypothetical protein
MLKTYVLIYLVAACAIASLVMGFYLAACHNEKIESNCPEKITYYQNNKDLWRGTQHALYPWSCSDPKPSL